MFRPVMQMSEPVKLRIGFVVLNVSDEHTIDSPTVWQELNQSTCNINMVADIDVIDAKTALNELSSLDGIFLSGEYQSSIAQVRPSIYDLNLHTLLNKCIENRVPVLSTSHGFLAMNQALIQRKTSSRTMNGVAQGTASSSFFIHPAHSTMKTVDEFNEKNSTNQEFPVNFNKLGILAKIFPGKHNQLIRIETGQHISQLSPLLNVEAYVKSKTENHPVAFSLASNRSYYLAVNWQLQKNTNNIFINQQLIKSFVLACSKHRQITNNKVNKLA